MMYYHTRGERMATAKVAITLKEDTLKRVDQLVKRQTFPSRSRVIQTAVEEKLERLNRNRLARACAQLDPIAEKRLAEEGVLKELTEWPEY
jgi:metal-responsive CopG/Arc/MetJ family transcriptional regulator